MTDPIWTWTHDTGSQSVHNQSLTPGGGGGGGVLGWVLDRDAQHRPLTRNATKGEKKGVETIHFAKFWQKVGVEIRHFPHFCTKIGVETIQIFQRPIKGGSKWRSICSNLHRVSTLPGSLTSQEKTDINIGLNKIRHDTSHHWNVFRITDPLWGSPLVNSGPS